MRYRQTDQRTQPVIKVLCRTGLKMEGVGENRMGRGDRGGGREVGHGTATDAMNIKGEE